MGDKDVASSQSGSDKEEAGSNPRSVQRCTRQLLDISHWKLYSCFSPHHEKDILAEIRWEVLVLVHGGWQIDTLVRVLKPLHVRVLVRDDRPSLKWHFQIN